MVSGCGSVSEINKCSSILKIKNRLFRTVEEIVFIVWCIVQETVGSDSARSSKVPSSYPGQLVEECGLHVFLMPA